MNMPGEFPILARARHSSSVCDPEASQTVQRTWAQPGHRRRRPLFEQQTMQTTAEAGPRRMAESVSMVSPGLISLSATRLRPDPGLELTLKGNWGGSTGTRRPCSLTSSMGPRQEKSGGKQRLRDDQLRTGPRELAVSLGCPEYRRKSGQRSERGAESSPVQI